MRRCFAFLSALTVVLASSTALAYTAKPIPCGNKPASGKAAQATLVKFNRRMFIDAYRKYGAHNPKWDSNADKFFEHYVAATAPNKPEMYNDLMKEGQAVMTSGCSDPLLATCVGILMTFSNQTSAADPILQKAIDGFKARKAYPGYCASLAPKYLLIGRKQTGSNMNSRSCEVWRQLAAQWMAESQSDGSFLPDEMKLRFECINSAWAVDGMSKALCQAMKKQPGVDPYVLKVVTGMREIEAAWECRGSDWGYTVTSQGWKGFSYHLDLARKALTLAWKSHPEYPQAPTLMITVAMAGEADPGETPRMWFDRAVAAEWDHAAAYITLENAILPRWGGSIEELYAFGAECARTKRFDSDVPWNLITELRQIDSEMGGKEYYDKPKTIELLNMVFDGYEKSGNDTARAHSKSARAAIAWYTGKDDEAKQILKDLGDKVDGRAFSEATCVPYEVAKAALDSGMRMWEPVKWSENGHYYQICRPAANVRWEEAEAAANSKFYAGLKGHLVTCTSEKENAFVAGIPHTMGSYWIGATRPRDKANGWEWVSSEPWSYGPVNSHPQAEAGKSALALFLWSPYGSGDTSGQDFAWWAYDKEQCCQGYVVEYEQPSKP